MDIKKELKDEFKKMTKREPTVNEEINIDNDALLLVRIALKKIEEIENIIKNKK